MPRPARPACTCVSGDLLDFDEFAAAETPRLLRVAYGLTGNPHDAWDLVQESLVRVGVRWRRLRSQNPGGYAQTVLVRLDVDRHRRLRREVPVESTYDVGADRPVETTQVLDPELVRGAAHPVAAAAGGGRAAHRRGPRPRRHRRAARLLRADRAHPPDARPGPAARGADPRGGRGPWLTRPPDDDLLDRVRAGVSGIHPRADALEVVRHQVGRRRRRRRVVGAVASVAAARSPYPPCWWRCSSATTAPTSSPPTRVPTASSTAPGRRRSS